MFSVHVRVPTCSELGQRVSFVQHLMSLAVVLAVRHKPYCEVRCSWHFTHNTAQHVRCLLLTGFQLLTFVHITAVFAVVSPDCMCVLCGCVRLYVCCCQGGYVITQRLSVFLSVCL